ncbi:helix-turn-helix domain-containing protein (plasmid) [Streptomyces seoulensis]|nr:helix-turn-helix domain-containing protein [Streptomyces seoulensis]
MNTTDAATQANVTVATIRTWCRHGVVTATKRAGRWIIDTASLAARIAIGKMKRPTKPAVLTTETLIAIGGRRWQKNGMDRVYINNWHEFAGLEASYYKTGNVSSASFQGRSIANGRVAGIMGAIDKVWFDAADGKLHASYYDGARTYEIRFWNGVRDTFDLVGATFDGIKAAVASL